MNSRFLFQAEDGIRDYKVTGVQTCALPIYDPSGGLAAHDTEAEAARLGKAGMDQRLVINAVEEAVGERSEERRVGKEWRSRRAAQEGKKKQRKAAKGK